LVLAAATGIRRSVSLPPRSSSSKIAEELYLWSGKSVAYLDRDSDGWWVALSTRSTTRSCRRTRTGRANSSGFRIAGDDPQAIDIASTLIREIRFDPVVIGGLAMGKYLVPGTPLGGEHTAAEIRQIVVNLH
jgi:hypothetical protein